MPADRSLCLSSGSASGGRATDRVPGRRAVPRRRPPRDGLAHRRAASASCERPPDRRPGVRRRDAAHGSRRSLATSAIRACHCADPRRLEDRPVRGGREQRMGEPTVSPSIRPRSRPRWRASSTLSTGRSTAASTSCTEAGEAAAATRSADRVKGSRTRRGDQRAGRSARARRERLAGAAGSVNPSIVRVTRRRHPAALQCAGELERVERVATEVSWIRWRVRRLNSRAVRVRSSR